MKRGKEKMWMKLMPWMTTKFYRQINKNVFLRYKILWCSLIHNSLLLVFCYCFMQTQRIGKNGCREFSALSSLGRLTRTSLWKEIPLIENALPGSAKAQRWPLKAPTINKRLPRRKQRLRKSRKFHFSRLIPISPCCAIRHHPRPNHPKINNFFLDAIT